MTIIEKLYAGKKLDEYELKCLAYGDEFENESNSNRYRCVDQIEGNFGRWTQEVDTIFEVGNDLWAVSWRTGLTECQEDEFLKQPYRVVKKTRVITEIYYEPLEGADVTV